MIKRFSTSLAIMFFLGILRYNICNFGFQLEFQFSSALINGFEVSPNNFGTCNASGQEARVDVHFIIHVFGFRDLTAAFPPKKYRENFEIFFHKNYITWNWPKIDGFWNQCIRILFSLTVEWNSNHFGDFNQIWLKSTNLLTVFTWKTQAL